MKKVKFEKDKLGNFIPELKTREGDEKVTESKSLDLKNTSEKKSKYEYEVEALPNALGLDKAYQGSVTFLTACQTAHPK